MINQYARFNTIHHYHDAIAQLFWAIEQAVINHYSEWEDEYVVQCVRMVMAAHRDMLAEHDGIEP